MIESDVFPWPHCVQAVTLSHKHTPPMMMMIIIMMMVMASVMVIGCRPSGSESSSSAEPASDTGPSMENVPMSVTVQSEAFQTNETVPTKYTGDGDDVSPPLSWAGAPAETREFALICDDPDAPSAEPWVHRAISQIPADATSLPEGMPSASRVGSPISALQGKNSWPSGRTTGYRGPAPPPGQGVHHYHFKVYALAAELDLAPDLTKSQLLEAIEPHVLASGELVGTYSR